VLLLIQFILEETSLQRHPAIERYDFGICHPAQQFAHSVHTLKLYPLFAWLAGLLSQEAVTSSSGSSI
jgi:hypothetical protein